MEPNDRLDAPIATFVEKVATFRPLLNPDTAAATVDREVSTWVEQFTRTVGVTPSKEQLAERRATAHAEYAARLDAQDAELEATHSALHREYSAEAARVQDLPDALERTYQAQREAKQPAGLSRTDELLTRLLDFNERQALEARFTGKTFAQLDAIHEAAVKAGDVATQRAVEISWREQWPSATHTPKGLAARTRLEQRIQTERANRVPASVRDGLAAIEKTWNNVTLRELRRIRRSRYLGIAK